MFSDSPLSGLEQREQGSVMSEVRGRSVSPGGRRSPNAPRSKTPSGQMTTLVPIVLAFPDVLAMSTVQRLPALSAVLTLLF